MKTRSWKSSDKYLRFRFIYILLGQIEAILVIYRHHTKTINSHHWRGSGLDLSEGDAVLHDGLVAPELPDLVISQ